MRPFDHFIEFAVTAEPSEPVREILRRSLYDWMACGIGGIAEPVSAIIRDQVLSN